MIIIQSVLRFLISLLERLQGKANPGDKEIRELKEIIDKVEQEKAKPVEDKNLQQEIDFWKK